MKPLFDFAVKNWDFHTRWDTLFVKIKDFVQDLSIESDTLLKEWIEYLLKKNGASDEMVPFMMDSLCVKELNDAVYDVEDVESRLEWIENQPKHEQRTPEWFEVRHNCITASMISKVLGTETERNTALYDKTADEVKQVQYGTAARHGVKYEAMAQRIYEIENNVTISEYGCIVHKDISYLASSPDGVVTSLKDTNDTLLLGRMLEIKCVYSRLIHGLPKKEYWMQTQIQLEVCDLEYCDFFECDIKEIEETQLQKDICGDTKSKKSQKSQKSQNIKYYGVCVETSVKDKTTDEEQTRYEYFFSHDYSSLDELLQARDKYIDAVLESVEEIRSNCWVLRGSSCLTIRRNRDWFASVKNKFKEFWEDVEFCRRDKKHREKLFMDKKKSKKTTPPEKVAWLGD